MMMATRNGSTLLFADFGFWVTEKSRKRGKVKKEEKECNEIETNEVVHYLNFPQTREHLGHFCRGDGSSFNAG